MSTLLFAYNQGDEVEHGIAEKLLLQKEKVYVVDFFASWCGSCEKEMPHLSAFDKNREDIEVIGVDVDKDSAKAEAFQKRMREARKLTFRVVNDADNAIVKRFNPVGMPALFIIKDGKVVDAVFGAKDGIEEILTQKIKELK